MRKPETPLMQSVREQIIAELDKRELLRIELAHALGFNPSYISNALNGNVNMTPLLAEKIAVVLDCEIEVVIR